MPLYQYKCECGKEYEELMSLHDAVSAIPCTCGKVAQQVFSACSFKVWNYDPSRMDAEAEAKRCGVER